MIAEDLATGLTFEERTHTYRYGGIVRPSVTQILHSWSPISLLDPSLLAAASALGRDVHDATALDDRGVLDESTVDEVVAPYLGAWRTFRADTGFEPTAIEQRVYNGAHGFAGTLDREGVFRAPFSAAWPVKPGTEALLEIKSGASCPTHPLQTAAYSETRGGSRRRLRAAVYLRSDGRYSLTWHRENALDWSRFLAAKVRYFWKIEHGI